MDVPVLPPCRPRLRRVGMPWAARLSCTSPVTHLRRRRGFDALSGRVCFPPAVRAQRIESVAATACEDDGSLVDGYAMALALLPGPQPADEDLAAGLASWLSERKGAPGRAGLNNPSREELRALSACFRLSCQLFDPPRCGLVLPFWWSECPRSCAAGSRGLPFDCSWEGMLALCTPSVRDERDVNTLNQIASKTAVAIRGPRPTRIVLLLPPTLPVPYPFVAMVGVLPGFQVAVADNLAARTVAPVRWLGGLGGSGLPDIPPETDALGESASLGLEERVCGTRVLPFWHQGCRLSAPHWVRNNRSSRASVAWEALVEHDRFSGMLGVPPPNLEEVAAALLEDTHRPRASTLASARDRLPIVMMRLFDGARDAWELSKRNRSKYELQRLPEMNALDSQRSALRNHERGRRTRNEKYSRGMAARRSARKRREWLHGERHRGGFRRVADLLSARPELRSAAPRRSAPSPRRRGLRARAKVCYDDSFVETDRDRTYFGDAGKVARARRRQIRKNAKAGRRPFGTQSLAQFGWPAPAKLG